MSKIEHAGEKSASRGEAKILLGRLKLARSSMNAVHNVMILATDHYAGDASIIEAAGNVRKQIEFAESSLHKLIDTLERSVK